LSGQDGRLASMSFQKDDDDRASAGGSHEQTPEPPEEDFSDSPLTESDWVGELPSDFVRSLVVVPPGIPAGSPGDNGDSGEAPAVLERTPKSGIPRRLSIKKADFKLDADDLVRINTNRGLVLLLRSRGIKLRDVREVLHYEHELHLLQIELIKLQRWVNERGKRVAILFEGRDAAGKGGTIRRFTEHLNPRAMRVVALPKPTEEERGQWYFQRYSKQLPNAGEIVFWDRSWYNRAVVEPVNGFCTEGEYRRFMQQVPEYEHMLYEDGVHIIKFWFSISKGEQQRRFESRSANPLKQWKLSPIDADAQTLWDDYTHYKEEMFSRTHTSYSPWIIVRANNKRRARLESIRYVLSVFPYAGKDDTAVRLAPDPNVVARFHRQIVKID
jgi:polyphosphate kinase